VNSPLRQDPPAVAVVFAALIAAAAAAAGTYSQPYLTNAGNAIVTACAALIGAMLVYLFYPSHLRGIAIVVLAVTLVGVGSTWGFLRLSNRVPDRVASLVGGCDRFNLSAQNRYPPLGTRIAAEPLPDANKVGGRAGNEIVTVDGWVRTRAPYPTNSAPWNSDIWFHLADQTGRVSFAGVRSAASSPDMNGHDPYGGEPAGLDRGCEGTVRWP
jgi:hypothetical protein